jgi:PIN domain nuclease of toxin-antitoxin system
VNVLLDTCAFVWLCCEPERFPPEARRVFSGGDPLTLYISDATILEMVVKSALGKLEIPDHPRIWAHEQCKIWKINVLPVTHEEIQFSSGVSQQVKDPFDSLIIATAITHVLPVVTDAHFFKVFGVDVVW